MSQKKPRADSATMLRPMRRLLATGVLAAIALTTPIFAVLYWLTVPAGTGWITALGQVVLLACVALTMIAYFDTVIVLGDRRIVERGFFGTSHVIALDRVHGAIMLDVYRRDALDTVPQLFLCDADGERLLRMRGQFWSRADMQAVLDRVDVPVHTRSEPVTMGEIQEKWPRLPYWFERRWHRGTRTGTQKVTPR